MMFEFFWGVEKHVQHFFSGSAPQHAQGQNVHDMKCYPCSRVEILSMTESDR